MKLMRFIGVCLLGCSFSLLQAASPETIRVTTGKTDLFGPMDAIWMFYLQVKMLTSLMICKIFSNRLYA